MTKITLAITSTRQEIMDRKKIQYRQTQCQNLPSFCGGGGGSGGAGAGCCIVFYCTPSAFQELFTKKKGFCFLRHARRRQHTYYVSERRPSSGLTALLINNALAESGYSRQLSQAGDRGLTLANIWACLVAMWDVDVPTRRRTAVLKSASPSGKSLDKQSIWINPETIDVF